MSGARRARLTDAAVARLRPRDHEYTVWDARVPGLGVRVRPSGGMTWVMLRSAGKGSRRVTLGRVSAMGVEEARRECHARRANPEPQPEPARTVRLFQDFVEGEWKDAHFDRCKASTRKGYRSLLDARLLPAFGAKPLDRISPAEVRRWFDDFSRTAPGNANNALRLLRQIMNFAVARGHVGANPTRGVKPNRRPALTRFLSREEIDRLHAVLDKEVGKGEGFRQQVDIIRLLLLTGCRRGEIVGLRRSEVDGDRLVLADSKTGPRKVPLGTEARTILERQPRTESPFVFPSPLDPSRSRGPELPLWYRVRREVGIEDVRLHDLRHTHASHAVMNGVPVPVVSRMLGHSNVRMTLRYAHLGDRDIEQAAERVGQEIADLMGLATQLPTLDTPCGGSSG